jgi:hypothetical protein
MNLHFLASSVGRWVAPAVLAATTFCGTLGFSSIASADPNDGRPAPAAYAEHRGERGPEARHDERGREGRRDGREARRGEHRRHGRGAPRGHGQHRGGNHGHRR